MNNKVLSDAEFSRLRQFIEDVLQLCAEDEDLDVEIGYEAETVGEILGIFPDKDAEDDE